MLAGKQPTVVASTNQRRMPKTVRPISAHSTRPPAHRFLAGRVATGPSQAKSSTGCRFRARCAARRRRKGDPLIVSRVADQPEVIVDRLSCFQNLLPKIVIGSYRPLTVE